MKPRFSIANLCCLNLVLILPSFAAGQEIQRPPITGFSHVTFYTTLPDAAKHFYADLLGLAPTDHSGAYRVGRQRVEILAENPPNAPSLLANIGFATDNAERLRRYLQSRGVQVPANTEKDKNGTRWFEVKDPEGNRIRFEQIKSKKVQNAKALSSQIIHVGFLVHDRTTEDKFYREILGFRPYWFGGRSEGHLDWVSLQVPEGRQWIEYMLTDKDAQITPERLGVLNHFSLGVPNIKETE